MPPDLPSQRPGMIDTFHQEFGNQDSGEIAQYYKIENSERHHCVAREPIHTVLYKYLRI